ncbi:MULTISPECIES: TetR/AcrR family transcriptional regulator [unclassified Clostridium]|uniref:TetR/AcrR family transcriptional regulator n=1 Tax=unclassified Clostridium TaxID=2614128 RepID=UPI000822A400|nr:MULTISPECIES: TetR/AcrR family transcriptional regulator [unclassified Clostridium]SCJ19904.1 HTH-type transcriptional repressor KstR2 [uncultured Clostridium sp.]
MELTWEEQLEQQRQARRSEIIETARTLFLKMDLNGVSMKDIAANSGISRVTLYKYFKSIDEVAFEVQMQVLGSLFDYVASVDDSTLDGLVRMRNHLDAWIDFYQKHTNYFCFVGLFDHYYRERYPSEDLQNRYRNFFKKGRNIRRDMIESGIQQGLIRPEVDAKDAAVTFTNIFLGLCVRLASREDILKAEQSVDPAGQLKLTRDILMQYLKK